MKVLPLLLFSLLAASLPGRVAGQSAEPVKPVDPKGSPPPPVSQVATPSTQPQPDSQQPAYVYEQKPMGGRQPLVSPEQAQGIIDRFKAAYPNMGNPRLVIYVNRELVDEQSGLKITSRNETVDSTQQKTTSDVTPLTSNAPPKGSSSVETTKRSSENRYRLNERKDPALADRQTVRDVERLFGRPLRIAGAALADQRFATQIMSDKSIRSLANEGEQARKDREALSKIADVAIEVLITSKDVSVAELTGDHTYRLPDIQATAIRLTDSRIVGQASTSDVLRGSPSFYARNYDVREITEATALALMEDMLTGATGRATIQPAK